MRGDHLAAVCWVVSLEINSSWIKEKMYKFLAAYFPWLLFSSTSCYSVKKHHRSPPDHLLFQGRERGNEAAS